MSQKASEVAVSNSVLHFHIGLVYESYTNVNRTAKFKDGEKVTKIMSTVKFGQVGSDVFFVFELNACFYKVGTIVHSEVNV